MSELIRVAVVGATGLVGQHILEVLDALEVPLAEVVAVASERSAGEQVSFGSQRLTVQNIANFDFSTVQVAMFAAGGAASAEWVPVATKAGCIVIDNSSVFRSDSDVPLVVPEVNPHAVDEYHGRNIIANPNCSTIQMVVALSVLHAAFGIERIIVSTYQSVSGAGQKGIDELMQQMTDLMSGREVVVDKNKVVARQIAFNVVPEIDVFEDNGYSREEMKLVNETRKIFEDEDIVVEPTAVRVPVFIGHAESIYIETAKRIELEQALLMLESAPGVVLHRDPSAYPTPFEASDGGGEVHVGRVRQAIGDEHGLHLWVVADNVGKGAAVNAVQILEYFINTGQLGG